MEVADIGSLQYQPADGGVLQGRRQCYHRLTIGKIADKARVGDPILGIAADHGGDGGGELSGITVGSQGDIQIDVPVVPILQRHIVTGKLELVGPFQLQGHRLQGNCGQLPE